MHEVQVLGNMYNKLVSNEDQPKKKSAKRNF